PQQMHQRMGELGQLVIEFLPQPPSEERKTLKQALDVRVLAALPEKGCQRRATLGKALAELPQRGQFTLVVMIERHCASLCSRVKGWRQPIKTVAEPAVTALPWVPALPSVAAGLPLITTVGLSPSTRLAPQVVGSPIRAAGTPSISTSAEPAAMVLVPWPVLGQAVGSPKRAAGLPDMVNSYSTWTCPLPSRRAEKLTVHFSCST